MFTILDKNQNAMGHDHKNAIFHCVECEKAVNEGGTVVMWFPLTDKKANHVMALRRISEMDERAFVAVLVAAALRGNKKALAELEAFYPSREGAIARHRRSPFATRSGRGFGPGCGRI